MAPATEVDQEGDAESLIRDLLEQHTASVFRMARSVVRDPALAEDVVQETFIKAWQNAAAYRGDVPIRNWLLRIAHNVAVSTLRAIRDQATDPSLIPDPAATGSPPDTIAVDRLTLLEALDSLDVTSRAVVVLREVEDLSYDEIAQVLDLSLPTVKTRLFRARARLRDVAKEGS